MSARYRLGAEYVQIRSYMFLVLVEIFYSFFDKKDLYSKGNNAPSAFGRSGRYCGSEIIL